MNTNLFICHTKCSTCKKAEKWLLDNGVAIEKRNIQTENPTLEEITEWYHKSGLDIKKLFNTSGMKYRELKLKDRVKTDSVDELLKLLSTDGMLVKRPVLVTEDTVFFGFKEPEYQSLLDK